MKSHYDIAIIGFWYGANYGSLLNGYAMYHIIKNFGKDVLMINKPGAYIDDIEITQGHNVDFIKKYYDADDVSPVLTYSQLGELNKICDCFCAGSDQIWNYLISFEGIMYLPFVENDKKLISFATSFGNCENSIPDRMKESIGMYLRRYNAISVREQFDVDILREKFILRGEKLIEPVFCIDKSVYDALADHSRFNENTPYLLAYILDPTPQICDAINWYAKRADLKVVCIRDGKTWEWESEKHLVILPNVWEKVHVEDLLKAYQSASYVITDSFHGTCFSIIFEKPFLSIANYVRGYERFSDLLGRLGLLDRLVMDSLNIPMDENFLNPIDYAEANKIIASETKKAVEWLQYAIETPKDQMPSIILPDTVRNVLEKTYCTGCSACANVCPVNAISLKPDDLGYYRANVDYDKCVGCGKCIEICPAINLPENGNKIQPNLFEFIAADEKILFNSSSGGAFPVLASEAFKMGGVVVGAAWRDDFSVEHIIIENEAELYKLQKSKYLQSDLENIFEKVKDKLDKGVFVLFSGCPCQAAGLKAYLKKEYDNLVIVDLLCGNAPSTMFFQKYIADDFSEPLEKYEFRHKVQGWNADCAATTTTSGYTEVRRGGKQDSYQRVYHNHVMCPPHCENCKYQNAPRFGDLTIGDFWGVSKYDKEIDTSKGVSAVLCNNEKGQVFFENIPQEMYAVKKQVPLEWLGGNGFVIQGSHNFCSLKRNDFYEAIRYKPFKEAIAYAAKPNHGVRSERGAFDFSAKDAHFKFDPSIWSEDFINGIVILTTKDRNPKTGNYAVMPIYNQIVANKPYLLKLRFKISTDAHIYNFHLKSAGETLFQVIYSHKVNAEDSTNWVEIEHEFIPDFNFYDEFMIGAAQLTGENRWIAIDYIKICDKH